MAVVWTPDPATVPWVEVQEDEVWAEPTITALDDDVAVPRSVTGYTHALIGEPLHNLHVDASTAGVEVGAPESLAGSFPAIDIEYQVNGVTGHCATWQEVPANFTEIIDFQPNPVNIKEWTLSVTAQFDNGSSESADFIIKVRANYTHGKAALVEHVNASRS